MKPSRRALRILNRRKEPPKNATKSNYVGIEIEFYAKREMTRDDILWRIEKVGLSKHCHLGNDASLYNHNGYLGRELRFICNEKDLNKKLLLLQEVLDVSLVDENNDPIFKVNNRCGIHVHLDMRNRQPQICYERLIKGQNLLFSIQPQSRVQSSWCHPVRAINKLRHCHIKYTAINGSSYSRRKTIEVRVSKGSLDMQYIYDWCKTLIEIVNTKGYDDSNTMWTLDNIKNESVKEFLIENRERQTSVINSLTNNIQNVSYTSNPAYYL